MKRPTKITPCQTKQENGTESATPIATGLSRRVFLQQSAASATLMALLLNTKPVLAKNLLTDETSKPSANTDKFNRHQRAVLRAVQLQLFPADGDGPSADDLNALAYLEWALSDPDNQQDGDRQFIARGINWLEDLAKKKYNNSFIRISANKQHQLMQQLAQSKTGDNWMSLLIYYLLEALLLDPVYGGNPNGIGWKWLQHQPGFPLPDIAHSYRHYRS